jgi:hypothetical protein
MEGLQPVHFRATLTQPTLQYLNPGWIIRTFKEEEEVVL